MFHIRSFLLAAALSCTGATAGHAVDGERLITQQLAMSGGITPGDRPGFPVTISRPGYYKLAGNLAVPAGANGIEATSGSVTLDLNGWWVDGQKGSSKGVSGQITRITNGHISDFGVRLHFAAYGTADQLVISGNFIGVAGSAELTNSVLSGNGDAFRCAARCRVFDNTFIQNGVGVAHSRSSAYSAGEVFRNVFFGGTAIQQVVSDRDVYEGFGEPPDPIFFYGENVILGANDSGLLMTPLAWNVCSPNCPPD